MIKTIFYDCYGVLVQDPVAETYRHFQGDPDVDAEYLAQLNTQRDEGKISRESAAKLIAARLKIHPEEWRQVKQQYRNVKLSTLSMASRISRHVSVGIISNAQSGEINKLFDKHSLDIFDPIVDSSEVGLRKPDTKIFEYALDLAGISPEEALLVDDLAVNCRAARLVGMYAIKYTSDESLVTAFAEFGIQHE